MMQYDSGINRTKIEPLAAAAAVHPLIMDARGAIYCPCFISSLT